MHTIEITPSIALDSLRWYAEMGVDLCVEDAPQVVRSEEAAGGWGLGASGTTAKPSPLAGEGWVRGRGELNASLTASPSNPATSAGQALPPQGGESSRTASPAPSLPSSIADAVAEARSLADGAEDLAALEVAVRGFNGCSLKKTATNTVFAQGVATSRLMFVGEAPGAEEDRSGVPFCGASGQLLDKMLSFIGLNRAENFYITNCLFWRPPGNRQPSAEELEICRPLVEKHIALVNPKMLVLVGGTATSSILRDTRGITRLRGQVFSYKNDYMAAEIPVHVIYHPSYLLRQPLAKKQAWADLLKLNAALTN